MSSLSSFFSRQSAPTSPLDPWNCKPHCPSSLIYRTGTSPPAPAISKAEQLRVAAGRQAGSQPARQTACLLPTACEWWQALRMQLQQGLRTQGCAESPTQVWPSHPCIAHQARKAAVRQVGRGSEPTRYLGAELGGRGTCSSYYLIVLYVALHACSALHCMRMCMCS